jgi:Zn-dependent metalloprotease/chitodextrinase
MKRILLFLVGIFMFANLQAQEVEKLYVGQNGTPSFIKFSKNKAAANLTNAQAVLKTYVFTQPNDEVKQIKVSKDKLNITHEKYQQYFKGIKVEYGVYTVNKRDNKIQSMNGEYVFIDNNFRTSPMLSENAARQKALQFVGAQKYMWQDANNEAFAKTSEKSGTYFPNGKLVIVQNFLSNKKDERLKPVLAYKFDIYAEKPLSRDFIYVDAATGEIVHKNPIIKHCFEAKHNHSTANVTNHLKELSVTVNTNGSAATRYSGNRTIVGDSNNGTYRLRETTRGNGIETYDMNTGTDYNSAEDFTDNDNNWTAAEHDNAQKDNAALDAHWGAEMTYDYWTQKHNRNSYDDNGATIKSYVHYDVDYDNAYWNGSVMTYGDGSDTYFDALTSLDVAGHEIGHAVCSNTANLTYSYESGAMNEGFSDIWGACIEYFAAPEKSTWLIGEDIEKRTGHSALRSMSDPGSEGQPDTYQGTNWATGSSDNGGVHTNSGVLNFWFYILSVGKSATNDNGDDYSVTGITIDKAAAIAYRMESVYLSANSQYADARTFAIQSAEDLYGAGSNEVIQTTNAWYAVGVGAEYGSISYCSSKGNNSNYEWIAEVTIGSFSNTSDAAGYTDYTSQTVDLSSGQSYAVSLVPGFSGTAYDEYWKIWIDFNKDGDFSDANELVFDAGSLSNNTVTGNMAIPAVAAVNTRMRVSMKYNAAQTECESFSYGEVEDYTVNITAEAADTQAPTAPADLSSANVTETSVDLSWTASTDNVGVTGYDVYKDDAVYSTVTGTSATVTELTAATAYSFYVKAKDAAGNISAASNTVNVTTNTATDTQAPTTPTDLASSNITETSADVSWTASTDNVGVTAYKVYLDGSLDGSTTATSYSFTGLTASTTYNVAIEATDAADNVSTQATTSFTTLTASSSCTNTVSSFPYSESFETGLGLWLQDATDDIDWTRDSGGTPSSSTGPSSASDGTYYMYVEASSPNYPSKIAIFNSPCYNLTSENSATFSFDYHMYGSNMGTLDLQAKTTSGTWSSVWTKTGDQGSTWLTASVDLSSYLGQTVMLRFVGTTGSSYRSDMTIDNINLSTVPPPACTDITLSITFDNYPEETSWTIKDASGNTVASGGTYASQADGSTLTKTVCLSDGCYDFTINDSYGDGICCSYGSGSYTLTNGSTTLASGGSFTSSETTNFCLSNGEIVSSFTNQSLIDFNAQRLSFKGIKVYPNPTSTILNIEANHLDESATIRIINMSGAVQLEMTGNKAVQGINVSKLQTGMYIIQLQTKKEILQKTFIKE